MPSYTEIVTRLQEAGCVFAEDEAVLLLDAGGDLERSVGRRVAGEPLEHIVGWVDFAGLRLSVEPGVFVPRRRTQLLARRAASLATPAAVVVDLCCGCGAVGAFVQARLPSVELHAADVSGAAVRCALRNIRGSVHQGDLYDALPRRLLGTVDVLVANAPYVPSGEIELLPPEARLHEPRDTLDGGRDGLDVIRRIVTGAPSWLSATGQLLFEVGRPQADAATALCGGNGLVADAIEDDGGATVVRAQR